MNSHDLFDIIGQTPDRYVLDALNTQQTQTRAVPPKRIFLIAAIVIMILCLVGCAVAYFFSLEDMKIGEYNFYVPPAYDEDGNLIPVETHAPITRISLQGANKDALAEWLAFRNAYDPDLEIAGQTDQAMKAGEPLGIPENYQYTYGCYSQEMVDRLNEIIAKYDLKLLSTDITCQTYESSILFDSLGIDSLFLPAATVEQESCNGYFFPEGTFDISLYIALDSENWKLENNLVSYRYSVKEFFDPAYGSIGEINDYTQWNYTRKDGKTVLLVLNERTARIYADLPDAFISIYVEPEIWDNGEKVSMTSVVLEEISELFDLSIKPGTVDLAQVEQLLAKARADYEAEQAAKIAEQIEKHESKYVEGYREYVNYRLETAYRPERMSYLLYDVNSDGTDELIIQSSTILSMKDGTSYKYFDINEVEIAGATFYPCEGNTFELCHELFAMHQYYFYRAEAEGASFVTGVIHDTNEDIWYRSLSGGSYDENIEQISAEEAQKIRDSYTRVEIDMLPLQKYGQEVTSVNYKHPYSKYIAGKLDRYEEAPNYQYALLDVNGDGIEELITRDYEIQTTDQTFYLLQIHSIKDGKLWDMGMDYFTYVCEGGILENTENFDDSAYHYFYRCTEDGVEPIEKIVRDPITLYWGHALADQDGKTVTEEKAKSILNSYKRLELDWKPFAEYPHS